MVAKQQKFKTRLKVGDEVMVIAGENKGHVGKIESFDKKRGRVYVVGTLMAKRHTRPNMVDQQGGILDKPKSIAISNVMYWDSSKKKPTRIGYKIENGKKYRYSKVSGVTL